MEEVDIALDVQITVNDAYEQSRTNSHVEPSITEPKENRKVAWLVQAQQRQQALTGLQSLCKQQNEENTETFSADSFCQLFSQEVCHHHNIRSLTKNYFDEWFI